MARRHPMWITYRATASTASTAACPALCPSRVKAVALCGSWCQLLPTSPWGMARGLAGQRGLRGCPALPRKEPWNPVPRKRPRMLSAAHAPGSRSRSGLSDAEASGSRVPIPPGAPTALLLLLVRLSSKPHHPCARNPPVPASRLPWGPLTQSTPTQRELSQLTPPAPQAV